MAPHLHQVEGAQDPVEKHAGPLPRSVSRGKGLLSESRTPALYSASSDPDGWVSTSFSNLKPTGLSRMGQTSPPSRVQLLIKLAFGPRGHRRGIQLKESEAGRAAQAAGRSSGGPGPLWAPRTRATLRPGSRARRLGGWCHAPCVIYNTTPAPQIQLPGNPTYQNTPERKEQNKGPRPPPTHSLS